MAQGARRIVKRYGAPGDRGDDGCMNNTAPRASTSNASPRAKGDVRVSVIVPVFSPKDGFDDLIASLARQSLDARQFEVILCDDGSGEPTHSRLAQVARDHENVRVLTLPHTGWPGTPRNHGIDAARGTYVQFVDQDDWLYDDALQNLCDYADLHTSDVVIGKVVGIGRKLPKAMFRRDIPHAQLGRDPLLDMLTPHKMFRTSFLRENDIRFPDGKVRLEDHLFVMRAYFAARTISILASRACYAWVKNPGSASSSRIDPETYFPHMQVVLELVEANTQPGELRDTLLRHWYRGKVLARIAGQRLLNYPDEYRTRLLDVVTPLAQRWFGPAVEVGLAYPARVRSSLLRAGRPEDLVRLAEFEVGLGASAEVTSARWTRGGSLQLSLVVQVENGDLAADLLTALPDAAAPRDQLDLLLADSPGAPHSPHSPRAPRRIARRAMANPASLRVVVAPIRAFARGSESVGGPLSVRLRHRGWAITAALTASAAAIDSIGPSPLLAGHRSRLVLRPDGSVEWRRDWPNGRVRDGVARTVASVRSRLHAK